MKNFAAALHFWAVVLLSTTVGATEGIPNTPQTQTSVNADVAAASSSEGPKKASPAPDAKDAKAAPSYLRQPTEKKPEPVASKKGPDLMRVILALFLVAILGGIAVYAKRRKGGARLLKDQVRLHTIGSVQLGPKSQIALLSVGREAILVGVSEGGVSCLRSYKEEELGSLTTGESPKKTMGALPPAEEEASEAFNQLLVRASKDDAKERRVVPSPAAAKLPPDQFTPTGFVDESLESGPRSAADDDMPPHLAAILAEPQHQNVRAIHSARPGKELPSASRSAFGEPEGQAAELIRRFSELAR